MNVWQSIAIYILCLIWCCFRYINASFLIHSAFVYHFQAIHGTLKTTVGPPNLGINLPLSNKPTNSNKTNSNSLSDNNNNRDGGNVSCQDKREKKPSPSLLKKKPLKTFKNPPSSGYTCGDCKSFCSSREVFVAHMRHEHGKVNVSMYFYEEVSNLAHSPHVKIN